VLLPDDVVRARRRESPFWGTCAWARDSLNATARDARQMAVIVDRDGVVLSREGDRKVIEVADELSFAPGAGWGEASVGCNAIGVSLATGRPAEVVGAQHQKHDQRSLSCWAAAVIHPTDKQIVGILNLTERSRRPNPAALDELTKTAHQLQQQLAAS
jgi:transcriptional regulator of acetoin/glycerol metabolism